MEPTGDRRQEPRRSVDVELASLSQAFTDLAEDVGEMKRLMEHNYVPRLVDLETWRTTWAATELEREKNRTRVQQNVISKREFVLGLIAVVATMIGSAAAIVGVVLSNS